MTSQPAAATGRRFGASVSEGGVRFGVWSGSASRTWVSIFDAKGSREADRVELSRGDGGVFSGFISGLKEGTRYGFRADGEYAPERGLWIDPDKLQVIRRTEKVLFPDRGAAFGNFGTAEITADESWVPDAELITHYFDQDAGKMPLPRGADGSVWLGRVRETPNAERGTRN